MSKISRRRFVGTGGAGVAAASLLKAQDKRTAADSTSTAGPAKPGAPRTTITINLNGVERRLEVEDRWTTVEGLAKNGKLDPLQEAFIEHDGPQCGFCTSGQLMSAKALLERNAKPTRDEVRAAMTGNICRCSNYNRYVEAVLAASGGTKA